MFYGKLYERMGHLCTISDKKAKQRYGRSEVSKLQPTGQIRPAKSFQPPHEGISFDGVDILSIMKEQYIYETFADFVECNLFRNNNIT